MALLASIGVTSDLGAPQVTASAGEVDVTVPLVVNGLQTDQGEYVAYGSNASVLSASGTMSTPTAGATYPTIAPTDVIPVLVQDHGFVFNGGIAPMDVPRPGTAIAPTAGPSGVATTNAPTGGITTTTSGAPVVDVEIDRATMELSTYTLTDGTTWLLPTWSVSGPESGATVTPPASYSADVLALSPQYVQVQPEPMVF